MDRTLFTVEIQTIERKIFNNPLRHIPHILIINYEITRSASALADQTALVIALERCVLIQFRCHSELDVLAELMRADTVCKSN